MHTFIATVHSTFVDDPKKIDGKGILTCFAESNEDAPAPREGRGPISVIYTSPFAGSFEGAMVAIPVDGTRIIVQEIGGQNYYISSIIGPDPGENKSPTASDIRALENFSCEGGDTKIYGKDGRPRTLLLKNPRGHKLELKDDRDTQGKVFLSKAELRSARKKVLCLDDSPAIDWIRLGIYKGPERNLFDGITIGHGPDAGIGAGCIKMETNRGNISLFTEEGGIKNTINEGKNFIVENLSRPTTLNTGPFASMFSDKANVHIGSQWGDVNLQTGRPTTGDTGVPGTYKGIEEHRDGAEVRAELDMRPSRIFIKQAADGGVVQIDSNGDIYIFAKKGPINGGGNITIESEKDITLQSGDGIIRLKAAKKITLEATEGIAIKTPLNCSIEGTKRLDLNTKGKAIMPIIPIPFTTGEIRQYIPFSSFKRL